MSGLEIGAALGVLAVAFWIKRLASIGVYLKAMIMVLALFAALTLLGVITISYDPDRVWELGGFVRRLLL